MEIWKDIKGFEGAYQISTFGRVKSLKRKISQGCGYRILSQKILSTTVNKGGYECVTLNLNGRVKTFSIHRLVALSFISNLESKTQVNHIDANKLNNHVSNLEWCTPKENMKHARENNLIKSISCWGGSNSNSKKVIDISTGKVYSCVKDAAADLDINYSQSYLSRMLAGKRRNKTTLMYQNESN